MIASIVSANIVALAVLVIVTLSFLSLNSLYPLYAYALVYQLTAPRDVSKIVIIWGVVVFIVRFARQGKQKLYLPSCFGWLFLFYIYGIFNYLVSFFHPKDISLEWKIGLHAPYMMGLNNLLQLGLSILIVVFVANVIRDKEQLLKTIKLFIYSSSFFCAISLLAYFMSMLGYKGLLTEFIRVQAWIVPRLYGTAVEPLAFSNQILLTLPLVLTIVAANNERLYGFKRPLLLFMLFIQSLAFLLTFSLGAFFAFFVSLLVLFLVSDYKIIILRIGLIIMCLLTFVYFIGLYVGDTGRGSISIQAQTYFLTKVPFLSSSERLLSDRASMNAAAWEMFKANPIMGIGIGDFSYSYKYYMVSEGTQIDRAVWKANNDWLTLLAEMGLIGTTLYFLYLFTVLKQAWQILRLKVAGALKDIQYFIFGLFVSSIAVLAQALFGYYFQNPYPWLLLGLMIAAMKIFHQECMHENCH
jgi:O-antigen ligase